MRRDTNSAAIWPQISSKAAPTRHHLPPSSISLIAATRQRLELRITDSSLLSASLHTTTIHLIINHIKPPHTTSKPCPAIIPISLCVAKHPASHLDASAINATENALSATLTSDRPPSRVSATSALSETTRTSASSAAARASVMPSTASNAPG